MKLTRDRSFYRTLVLITLPIALQNLIASGVGMMDTVMLGQLGDLALSASSLANQPFNLYSFVTGGIAMGGAVIMAQYWGKNDMRSIKKVMAIALRIAFAVALAVTALVAIFPSQVMRAFTNDRELIMAGASYLRIAAFSYFFFGITNTLLQVMRSVEKVVMSLVIYGISFFINIFFNYMFIFGKFGAPEMGIAGAAVGTLLARVSEFLMTLFYLAVIDRRIRLRPRDLLLRDGAMLRDFAKHSLPIVANETLWGCGTLFHASILGHTSKMAVTASSICNVVQQLALIAILGVASSASVLIGKSIGAGEYRKTREYADTIQVISFVIGILSMTIVFFARGAIISIYRVEPETAAFTSQLLIVYAVCTFFQCALIPTLMGTLRGGGDGNFVMAIDLGTMYLIAIPLGWLAAFYWKLPVLIVCVLLKIDEPLKLLFSLPRLKSGKWIRNLTRDSAA